MCKPKYIQWQNNRLLSTALKGKETWILRIHSPAMKLRRWQLFCFFLNLNLSNTSFFKTPIPMIKLKTSFWYLRGVVDLKSIRWKGDYEPIFWWVGCANEGGRKWFGTLLFWQLHWNIYNRRCYLSIRRENICFMPQAFSTTLSKWNSIAISCLMCKKINIGGGEPKILESKKTPYNITSDLKKKRAGFITNKSVLLRK